MNTIFFASDGPKPQLVFPDALNMDPVAIRNTDSCLQYDRRVGDQEGCLRRCKAAAAIGGSSVGLALARSADDSNPRLVDLARFHPFAWPRLG